mmetsp:Transcript_29072/g.74799  ORF Transcript_29072/g.74799 Transcript_29072/m.74799 type:complete len:1233 (+) Transcript_29072:80-3778(+)
MSSFTLNALLEKTENRDKDFRYMATSDLLTELSKESFKPDSDGERRMCKCLLALINDQSSDVQSLAVKCLSPLVRKVHEELVDEMMMSLCKIVLTGSEDARDICAIGLKTVVLEMPPSMAGTAIRRLTPQLIQGVSRDNLEVKLECLEVLNDLLRRFAAALAESESKECLAALFGELNSARAAARKRAISCIASLSASLPDRILEGQLVGSIFTQMAEKGVKAELRRTYILTLAAISRSGGYRLGKQLGKVVPLVLDHCMPAYSTDDAEMIESCLQALEAFVARCPKEVGEFHGQVGEAALAYLSYDPNYAADDDEDMAEEEEDMEDDDDDDDGDYSDDDDVSWKVRRAAAKLLSSLVLSRPDRLEQLLPKFAPTLIARFAEREENVKMDVFSTFNDLLQQVAATRAPDGELPDAMAVDDGSTSATALLRAEVPRVVKAAVRQLKEKSQKTRIAAFHSLRQLVTTLPGCLAEHAGAVVPGIAKALADVSSNTLRIESLLFLRLCLASHEPAIFQPFVATVLPSVLVLANDRYYKTVAEALRVCTEIVTVLRPNPPEVSFAYDAHVPPLFAVVEKRLQAQDQDQEVKECAIVCMGAIVTRLADQPVVQLPQILPLLLERMRNEITRVTTVKTFAAIAEAKLDVALTTALPTGQTLLQAVVGELCSFLRKTNRPLRQASLATLDVIMAHHAGALADADVAATIAELSTLVSDSDLHVAHLALVLGRTITAMRAPSMAAPLGEVLLPRGLALLQSSLLQGVALRSLLALFAEIVAHELPSLDFEALTAALLALPSKTKAADLTRHSLAAVSQAVAACCERAPAKSAAMVDRFVGQLGGADAAFSLLCLGEIGKRTDLSAHATLLPTVTAAFTSADEDTRSAASFALGSIAAGNLATFVPHLLAQVDSSDHDYLMLHAFKEMLGSGGDALASFASQLLPKLLSFAERDEEGVRNVVAECLGRLAAVAPAAVVPQLEALLPSPSAATRSTVIACIRCAVTELGVGPLPPPLQSSLLAFLATLEDADLKVRRGAVLALNCLAHNKPSAIKELLPTLLPLLYGETAKRPELVHQVDLGPFKHTVDDGLEIRKAAFETMETLLSKCSDRLEFSSFLQHLVDGLKDDGDIKLLCHRMLIDLTQHAPAAPVATSMLDAMVEPLRGTLTATLKENAVKQQVERHNELVRSAMRAVRALEKLPDAESVAKFGDLVRTTLKSGKLAERYAAVVAEEQAAEEQQSA